MATRIIEPLAIDQPGLVNEWVERIAEAIDIQFVQHAVAEDKQARLKVSYLLANMGPQGYKLIKSYSAPQLPNTKTYDQLIKILKDNLAPKPSAISEGYLFANLTQETGENLSMFMARIKEKASYCEFGDFYDRMVNFYI